ncbi:alpha/beta hydrolase [Hymenobacter sp. UV11]|uniref:alpha/beta fold hydrolase n=1 Tax=Hymenobacter sp. UV11 TaxID=1849735 RepID=UPI00105F8CCF|nr:alpha/beta hydrolase [Hymenobacter sp. UV11]TDN38449.1 arylesterase [Hymenobacter sp. UV11]TFZ67948.1 alpha/beta hydrolase [Hymenobacter sp. UV11]
MNLIKVGQDAQGKDINLNYYDYGQGNPIVLIHGWPLSAASWEYQLAELPLHDVRVIAYDRRGFGMSSKPWDGYNYDTFADDLKAVLDALDLQNVTLVGFSMGGGEVARYMSRHNGARVSKVAFISAVTPFMLKTENNDSGVDKSTFDDMIENLGKDRFGFLQDFSKNFYGQGVLSHPVSQGVLDSFAMLAFPASPRATSQCVKAFGETDFRQDMKAIKVPALFIYGTSDAIVPPATGAEAAAPLVPGSQLVAYDGEPHGLNITSKDRLNRDLLTFVSGQPVQSYYDQDEMSGNMPRRNQNNAALSANAPTPATY